MQKNLNLKNNFVSKKQVLTNMRNVADNFKQIDSSIFRSSKFSRSRGIKRLKKNKNKIFSISPFELGLIGRPYTYYNSLELIEDYLYLSVVVRPNNAFCHFKKIFSKKNPINDDLPIVNEIMVRKANASKFKIKITRRGLKSKVLTFLTRFLDYSLYIKCRKFPLVVVDIITPKVLRKKVIALIYKSFLSKKFKKKDVILNIKHQKVFNGCRPRKQIRKKRRKFRLFK